MIYEYRCDDCNHQWSERSTMKQRNLTRQCPSCEGFTGSRKFSAPHNAAIPGIYNKVNRNWNEGGEEINSAYLERKARKANLHGGAPKEFLERLKEQP